VSFFPGPKWETRAHKRTVMSVTDDAPGNAEHLPRPISAVGAVGGASAKADGGTGAHMECKYRRGE